MSKKKTIIERNAEYVRDHVERGGVAVIHARYGRSDHNGNHVRAVDQFGRVLGRAHGGGYDVRCAAMWEAVQGVINAPTDQLTGAGSDRFGCLYANFGDRWDAFFAQFGWSVKAYKSGVYYVVEIRKEAQV